MEKIRTKAKEGTNVKAAIFDFQKYSIHDGPGIRTIVFLKGCPLKCIWCSNPESQVRKPQVVYFDSSCINYSNKKVKDSLDSDSKPVSEICKKCEEACPKSAIKIVYGKVNINKAKCDDCGICVEKCPSNSLRFWGKEYTVDEVVEEVMKDHAFYRRSGGGVTLSGGEPLMEPVFAFELLKKLKENFINTAIETCGFGSWHNLKKLLDYTDVILFDIKHVDPLKHHELTGVDNKIILENLKKAVAYDKSKVIVRVPLVPGYNTDFESLDGIYKLIDKLGVREIHFLPYHRLGESKYEKLNMDYNLKGLKTESNEFFNGLLKEFVSKYPKTKTQVGG